MGCGVEKEQEILCRECCGSDQAESSFRQGKKTERRKQIYRVKDSDGDKRIVIYTKIFKVGQDSSYIWRLIQDESRITRVGNDPPRKSKVLVICQSNEHM